MLTVGLTGGIGAGKSVVSNIFASLGVPVIDADIVSRQILLPGSDVLAKLVEKLGSNILSADGSLKRDNLKQLIFEQAETRHLVESIVHPAIQSEMLRQLSTIKAKYCLLVVPLLVEKHWDSLVDRILLVDAPESIRIQRIRTRDNLNTEQIQQILNSQATYTERISKSDDIIHNDKDLAYLTEQILALHKIYSETDQHRKNR